MEHLKDFLKTRPRNNQRWSSAVWAGLRDTVASITNLFHWFGDVLCFTFFFQCVARELLAERTSRFNWSVWLYFAVAGRIHFWVSLVDLTGRCVWTSQWSVDLMTLDTQGSKFMQTSLRHISLNPLNICALPISWEMTRAGPLHIKCKFMQPALRADLTLSR